MKERLDVILVNKGLAPSREKAKALIMAGEVYVNGEKEDKAGSAFDESTCTFEVRSKQLKYVSRGGFKLEKAMNVFEIDLTDRICMDIGSSTGGFTDCMLKSGARKVYSIDVGRGQLDWKLRNDERVVCMEQTNFRFLTPDDIPDKPDFASIDVSFISLDKILIPARNILKDSGKIVALIKPQFEAGKDKVGKNGVVRDIKTHEDVIKRVIGFASFTGFDIIGTDYSPIKGPEGNIEYLMYLKKKEDISEDILKLTEKEAIEIFTDLSSRNETLTDSEEWTHKISQLAENSHRELSNE